MTIICDLQEGPEPVEEGVKLAVGHKFVLNSGAGSKHYCEKCNAVIWGMLQQWYRCSSKYWSTCLNLRFAWDVFLEENVYSKPKCSHALKPY